MSEENEKILVSVITPTSNDRLKFLEATKFCFDRQIRDIVDLEWIIVTDIFPKELPAELTTLFNLNNSIKIISCNKDTTVGEKRNIAVENAKGTIIVHFDDDDYYCPSYVKDRILHLNKCSYDVTNCRQFLIRKIGVDFLGICDLEHPKDKHFDLSGNEILYRKMDQNIANSEIAKLGYGFGYVYYKHVWDKVKFNHVNFSEDSQFLFEVSKFFNIGNHWKDYYSDEFCIHYLHSKSSSKCYPQWNIRNDIINSTTIHHANLLKEAIMPKIAVCMIAKNEEHIIGRCLESIKNIADELIINNNSGIEDATSNVAVEYAKYFPVNINLNPWVDFATNRNIVLDFVTSTPLDVDYILMMDADDQLVFDPDFDIVQFKLSLTEDAYNIKSIIGNTVYDRCLLFKNKPEYRYEGVVHEYLKLPPETYITPVSESNFKFHLRCEHLGNRSKNPNKYLDDATLIKSALDAELVKVDSNINLVNRYKFYLARSYECAGLNISAMEWYIRRFESKGWEEEQGMAGLALARLLMYDIELNSQEELSHVEALLNEVIYLLPNRAEPRYELGKFQAKIGNKNIAINTLLDAAKITMPVSGLFIESDIYLGKIQYELMLVYKELKDFHNVNLIFNQLKESNFFNGIDSELLEKIESGLTEIMHS